MRIHDQSYALIMAGGKGERFWPLSTEQRPKQLLALAGDKPLIVQAVERLEGVVRPDHILIVTNAALVEPIRELLGPESPVSILGEPVGRDTAAAIAAGAAWIQQRNHDAVFCVMTADHIIGDLPIFKASLAQGLELCANHDILMTIGITPSEPSSAYGYIEAGDLWNQVGGIEFFRAKRFVEKPTVEVAKEYLATERYSWNSGMFIWSLESLRKALKSFQPELAERVGDWAHCESEADFQNALERDFPALPKISIDYAVMEKADNIMVCRGTFAWDDVGSWPALEAHLPQDSAGNAIRGDVEALSSARNIIVSEKRLTALVGVENLIVVQTEGVTLVCGKDHAQDIKQLIARLRAQKNREGVL